MSLVGESSKSKSKWGDPIDDDEEEKVEIVEFGERMSGGGTDDDDDSEDEQNDYEELSTEPEDVDYESQGSDEDKVIVDPFHFGDVHEMEGSSCACLEAKDNDSALALMEYIQSLVPNYENHYCIIDNIIRSYNQIFGNTTTPSNRYRVGFSDLFFRLRHEILFNCMCMAINIPVGHSDMPFSKFGIESNRTPDLIVEDGGVIKIIEVTAVSSIERAALNKGMDQMGFESKYQSEINEFNDKGISTVYLPLFFDMSNPSCPTNNEQMKAISSHFKINEPYKNLMVTVAKEMAILSQNLKNSLMLPASILFSGVSSVVQDHQSLEFLYRKSRNRPESNYYKEIVVSPQVYNKVTRDKMRMFNLLDNNSFGDTQKLVFVINTISHRMGLIPNPQGETINNLRSILMENSTVELLKFVKLKMGNVYIESTDSDSGVKFFERQDSVIVKSESFVIPLIRDHAAKEYKGTFNSEPYRCKIQEYKKDNYHSIHYDKEYEGRIIEAITDFDSSGEYSDMGVDNLLGNLESKDIDIDAVMQEIKSGYIVENSENEDLPIRRLKMKQPFVLPIANLNESSYCSISTKNFDFITKVAEILEQDNPYTSIVIKNIKEEKYNFYQQAKLPSQTLMKLMNDRYSVSNDINQLQKKAYKDKTLTGDIKLSKIENQYYKAEFTEMKKKYNLVDKEVKSRMKSENITSNISYIRLPTKGKNTNLRRIYDKEMKHFKDKKKQSTIEGVGIIENIESDYASDLKIFNDISMMLCENRGNNPDVILDTEVYEDARLLKDLKVLSINNYRDLINQVKNSCLGHAAAFISRMAHSLMFYSQLPFSSDYIRVDNLGYKNCLLIVRGGKKIFKSKSSKLYRLIYPISERVLPWYTVGHSDKGSFSYFEINGQNYALTPWSMMHESVLTDAISFYPRVSSFTFLNLNPEISLKQQFHSVSINILLSFHNRRHTEVVLANLRYILLSTLGDYTGIEKILPEFFGFNYDRFQSFVRSSILLNYPNYFKQLQALKDVKLQEGSRDVNLSDFYECRLKNVFTGNVVSKVEDLALMIYSTFLMTKAPYQRIAERSRNLVGILKIHEQFDNEVGLSCLPEEQTERISVTMGKDLKGYAKEIFKSDFNFDPKFCAVVGNFVNSILINQGDAEDIESSWIRIMNQPWDEMATSTGLRGDYEQVEDFWGQKGYFVVYKQILNTPGYPDKIMSLFTQNLTDDEKRKMLRSLNEVFNSKASPDREFLIFHAVDKVQWRGGREIYVMDLMTKAMQQPIEKFMAVLCKKMDNELISIPSDRRAQVIHHSIFEKDLPLKDMLTWYLTLDCSKWAPKSVFIKFVVTFLNMTVLPNSFKTHFMNYIEKLYKKRIYFNVSEVEALHKNFKYKDIVEKYLIKDDSVKGYYLEMPYSWVMGIFNYTSSFLHAANQKYFSYILMKTSLISYKEESSIIMFAHSDDSGGRLSVSSKFMAKRALVLYEIFLKSCNHLLSKKKSVVSRIYFEILSVIYLFKKLLALLPKFLGGLRFLPTDKGPAQDMLQSYSKSIEVMVAGADFQIAYLVMKTYSYMVWRFYYNRTPSEQDYSRPVQYLGIPDAHPLFVLLCGSDADLLRLIRNKVDLNKMITFVNTFVGTTDGEGPIKPLKFEIKVKGVKRGFEEFIDSFKDITESWSVRNVNYHNTAMNSLSFLRKLSDSGFVGSLVNESTVRRISRSFFIRNGDSAITRMGNVKLQKVLDSISLCQSYSQGDSAVLNLLKDVLSDENLSEIENEFKSNFDKVEKTIVLMKETLKAPLKIYKYLEILSMEGRKINESRRTLKPTLVQLVRSSKVFSNDFDPPSLVSYVKEPEMNWALQNVRGLMTSKNELNHFMEKSGFSVEETSPDMLLRVCRTYGRDSTKSIYLYSRVPGDIRQIKTYSAFLTFLSVNSFNNKEISGLTLKLSEREMSKEYLQTNLHEEIYIVNNLISLMIVLMEKCGLDFVKGLKLLPIPEVGFPGGGLLDLTKYLDDIADVDVRYNLIRAQINCLKWKAGEIKDSQMIFLNSSYYTFLKNQKSRSGWYGQGEVYIHVEGNFYSFKINNTKIEEVYTNRVGKLPLHHAEFILDVCENIGVSIRSMPKIKPLLYNKDHFGVDTAGEISVLKGREMSLGVRCTIIEKRNDFVDNLSMFTLKSFSSDSMIIQQGFEGQYIYKKIHILPIKKAEIVPTIRLALNPKDFEDKMLEIGLNDFEEFIYTEILTEMGKELFIDFTDLFDNYLGSRLYEVIKNIYDKGYTKISKKLEFNPLPASEGSLVRLFIDYSRETGDNLIKVPINLNPTIMRLRSEYPERMATLMGEKLVQYHNEIYSEAEKKEITDSYMSLSESSNLDEVRDSVIKLMTYWGYGGLVNSIQDFKLVRRPENYLYFNRESIMKGPKDSFSNLFSFLMKEISECAKNWAPIFSTLETPLHRIHLQTNPETWVSNFIYGSIMSVYGLVLSGASSSIYTIQFSNALLGFLKEETFVADLQGRINKNYLLSSIPISWKYRYDFIALINTLKDVWCSVNKVEFDLDYYIKLQRLPDNVRNYRSFLKDFELNLKSADTYYHGYQSGTLFSYISGLSGFEVPGRKYRITSSISKKSSFEIPMTREYKFKRPFKNDILDHELMEDFLYELTMGEVDEDTVNDMLEEMGGQLETPSTVRRLKVKSDVIIMAKIKWIIMPNISGRESQLKFFRQVGENIVVVSDTLISSFTSVFPNSGIRYFDPTRLFKEDHKPMFLHYSLHKDLNNNEFLRRYLKGEEFSYNESDKILLRDNYVRSSQGSLCLPVDLGVFYSGDLMSGEKRIIDKDGYIEIVDKKELEISPEPQKLDDDSKFEKVNALIDSIESENKISKDSVRELREKYVKQSINKGLPLSILLKSIMKEKDLMGINNEVLSNTAGISAEDQKKMFLAPEYFGVSHSISKNDINPIKDKKIRSEINSFASDMSTLIGSNTLKLSFKMKKVITANFKMWIKIIKTSKFKIENKGFLMTVFTAICNNACVSSDESDDILWQSIINKTTIYLAEEDPESSEDEDVIDLLFNSQSASRLRYRALG